MTHDIEDVTTRWQRRYADQERAVFLFAQFRVGDLLPGTMAHDQMMFAIAKRQLWHAIRKDVRRLTRRLR